MLRNVDRRRKAAGLSIRGLAKELEISHSLLSLVLSGRRNASKGLRAKFETWMVTPLPGESEYSPRSVLQLMHKRPLRISNRQSYITGRRIRTTFC
jgi:transcriptional regulator with XRE-family HTH domain